MEHVFTNIILIFTLLMLDLVNINQLKEETKHGRK